ncbi:uncharacterized protein [Nicotiana tomentosiformis]|uniref:uncharacterized protein n=1 Tax=Nicotiana tomentosiformis TaxID=4098 RepID=UPI00388C8660
MANVLADSMSRKAESMGSLALIPVVERPLAMDVQELANRLVRLDILELSRVLDCIVSRSSLFKRIKDRRYDDPHLLVLRDIVQRGGAKEVTVGDDDVFATKMYRDLKLHYWWTRIKKDIVGHVARCLNCQHVKYEHQRPGGLLQKIDIPE